MSDDPPNLEWTVHDDQYLGDLGPENHELPHLINSYIGQTLFHHLNDTDSTRLAGQTTKGAPLEHINTFFEGYDGLKDAADDVAVGHRLIWDKIGTALQGAREAFEQAIAAAEHGLTGATASAMFGKARESLNYLNSLADAAERMDPLVDTFSRDIKETRDWFLAAKTELDNNAKARAAYMGTTEDSARDDLLTSIYNREAQRTIHTFYNPPIEWISQRHPDMSAGPPHVGGPPGGPGAGGPGGGPPGGLTPGGVGAPDMPSLSGLGPMDPSALAAPSTPTQPANALQGLGDAAKGAGDAANNAGQQAQNAAGQAGNAANQALGQAGKAGQGGGLPEGVLGLGPKGLTSAKAASGSRGGGGSGGAGTRPPAAAKPTAPLTQPSKAVTAVPASRSGVTAGSGSSGAGAPVAGQRAAAGSDKEHKANKALRRTKNGQEVIGEAEGVVPVVGDDRKET